MSYPEPRLRWIFLFAAALVYVGAYLPLRQAGWIWDDDAYVLDNTTLRDAAGLWRMWFEPGALPQYYPLVHTTFWIEYQLWGLEPLGYHIDNWILHGINAWLVFRLLRRYAIPYAGIAAFVFLIHPVHVESVAWVTERKNVLSGMFYLAAWLAWLRYAEDGGWKRWALTFALFCAALMSKSVTATLPAAILLVHWWRDGRVAWKEAKLLLPFFLIGITSGLYTAWIEMYDLAGTGAGASGEEWDLSLAERLLVVGRAFWFYPSKIVWPDPLVFVYPRWVLDTGSLVQWLWPVATVAVLAALFVLRGRIGRAPLTIALFHAGTLLPALGFLNVYPFRYSFVADHFQYLASLGVTVGAVGLLHRLLARNVPGWVLGVVLAVPLAPLTYLRVEVYEGVESLWLDTIAQNEACWMAHHNLALHYKTAGRHDEALVHLRRALQHKPDHHGSKVLIGHIAVSRRDLGQAEQAFREVLGADPEHFDAWCNLGMVQGMRKQYGEAEKSLRTALRIDPSSSSARQNLGIVLLARGDPQASLAVLETGLEFDPNDAGLLAQAALALLRLGRRGDAHAYARRALALDPDERRARKVLGR